MPLLQLLGAVEHLLLLGVCLETDVEHRRGGHDCEEVVGNPSPEDNVLRELDMLELFFLVHVEYLKDVSFPALHWRLQGHDVLAQMHDGVIDLGAWPAYEVALVEELNDCELWSPLSVYVPY